MERRGRLLGMLALVACACGALGGDPRLLGAGRTARQAPSSGTPSRAEERAPAPAAGVAVRHAPVPFAPPPPAPAPPPPPEPRAEWRFRSSSPLSGAPAVSPAGLVYLASVEGYLHALSSDGSFRWSYGLGGMPVGAPAVDPAGHVFVATLEPRLYAFKPDGHLSWVQGVPARFATPPVWAAPGVVYYAGRDRNLYSVAAWGSASLPHWLGGAAQGGLATLRDGEVAVSLAAAEVQVFRRAGLVARLELPAPSEQALIGGKTHWYAVTGAGLAALEVSTRSLAWTVPARRAGLSADERALAIESEGDLVWLEPASGRQLHRMQLPGPASAAPAVTNSGIALVPLVSGGLLVLDPTAQRLARIPVGKAPAWPPVWSEASRRATAAAGGDVVGVDLSSWASPLDRGLDSRPVEDEAPSDAPGGPPASGEPRPWLGSVSGSPAPRRALGTGLDGASPHGGA